MNIKKQKVPIIAREESSALYGVAILMMLYHHLFLGGGEYFSIFGSYQMTIAWLCKICVAIYAFITGYGFCTTSIKRGGGIKNDLAKSAQHLIKFYKRFWITFIVTVSFFIFLGLKIGSARDFIMNITGWHGTYSGSWWYIRVYIFLVCAFPFVNYLFKQRGNKRFDLIKNIILGLCIFTLFWIIHIGGILYYICGRIVNPVYFAIYLVGYLCACISEIRIHEKFYYFIRKFRYTISLLCFISCLAVRIYLCNSPAYNIIDIVIIAPWIYSLIILLRKMVRVRSILAWFGKYSVYMWLTHGFFNSYFSSFVFHTKFSVVIYLTSISLSLAMAIILSKLEGIVDSLGKHMREFFIKKQVNTDKS